MTDRLDTTTTDWDATLDVLEVGVQRAEAAIESGEVLIVDAWRPPEGLGPLPEALQERATSLSWRMAAVEQRARERRDVLQAELDEIGRRRGAGMAYAAAGPSIDHTE